MVLTATVLSACGGTEVANVSAAGAAAKHAAPGHSCQSAGRIAAGRLQLCQTRDFGKFMVRRRGKWRLLIVGLPKPPAVQGARVVPGAGGHWVWAAASPDGRTVLAQWSGACEVPTAFSFDPKSGQPLLVTGPERSVQDAPTSEALGWTTDGREIVFVPRQPGCGASKQPGVYFVTPDGERTLAAPWPKPSLPRTLQRSLRARTPESIIAALRR